jgi:hypothetical protein
MVWWWLQAVGGTGGWRAALVGFVALEVPCIFSFCATERGYSGERKNKVKVINKVKSTAMYVGGGGDTASAIVWHLL